MSDSAKQYPISDTKLKRLRSVGVVPVSHDFQTSAVIIGFLLGCIFSVNPIVSEIINLMNAGVKVNSSAAALVHASSALEGFVGLLLRVIVPVLALVVLVGWYQSGFLLRLNALSFNPGQIFAFVDNLIGGLHKRFALALLAALKTALWLLLIAGVFVYIFSSKITNLSLSPILVTFQEAGASNKVENAGARSAAKAVVVVPPAMQDNLQHAERIAFRVCLTGVLFALFIGIAGRLIVVWVYQLEHRMTRTEVEEEDRETEVSPEIHKAYQRSREESEVS